MKTLSQALHMTVFLAALLSFTPAHAVLLKETAGAETFENKPLIAKATLLEDDKTEVSMSPVAHGLRKKTVFGLVTVNVYTLQFMAAQPEKIMKDDAKVLASLKEAGPIHLRLTFMRDLPGEKISESFKDGLKANNIDVAQLGPEMTQILKEISSIKAFKENNIFSITVSWAAGDKATVYLASEGAKIISISGSAGFADQLLSIWFGKPADPRLADLKKALLK